MTTISHRKGIVLDGNGVISLSSGKDAYADIIDSAIKTVVGELQLDVDAGVPYFDTVFKNYGGINQWKNAVRSIINSYDFVISISSFEADVKDGNISYEIVIQTDDGDVAISNTNMV